MVDQEHLPHTKEYDSNWRCDKKTRGNEYSWARILEIDKQDPRVNRLDERMVEWEIEGEDDIVALCNPNQSEPIDADFVARVLEAVGGGWEHCLYLYANMPLSPSKCLYLGWRVSYCLQM